MHCIILCYLCVLSNWLFLLGCQYQCDLLEKLISEIPSHARSNSAASYNYGDENGGSWDADSILT